ncbi:MAG: aldo/keto reductase, partial [Treponema sp.]|nr:aldo/keto reductase [Treponema sp.]
MDLSSRVKLNNGVEVPYLGLGMFESKDGEEAYNAAKWALETGYRHIDTAMIYGNEDSVGKAIKDSGIP